MAPHFGLSGEKQKKKTKKTDGFTWFETTVNGGAVVLSLLKDAAACAPLPYLRNAAGTTLSIIQIAQTVKDNRADFRRLCEDAATLTVVVFESRQRSEDPDRWPGPGLKDSVDIFLSTLKMIAEFAEAQVDRARFIRVMNSVGDGNKIRDFRERLAQAMNRFEVSAHLQSYDILRLIKNMMEDYKDRLDERVVSSMEAKEDRPLPAVSSDTEPEEIPDEQVLRDQELEESLAAVEKQKSEEAEQEARKEQEVVNEKLQQILRMLENGPEPGRSSEAKSEREDSSSDEENMLKAIMKNAAEKRADRESRKKGVGEILKLTGSVSSPRNPYSDIASLHAGISNLRVTSKNSGNVNSSLVYGSHNDNSIVTRISKTKIK